MARFVLVNRFREGQGPVEGSPAHDDEMRDWRLFNKSLSDSGDLVWSLALDEVQHATACTSDEHGRPVRLSGRDATPEGLFALYLVEVPDASAAEQWAERMPTAAYGAVEVRAVMGEERG